MHTHKDRTCDKNVQAHVFIKILLVTVSFISPREVLIFHVIIAEVFHMPVFDTCNKLFVLGVYY